MKKIFIAGLALTLIFTSIDTLSAFGSTGWHSVSWTTKYLYPNGPGDTNTYLKRYLTNEGSYDAINAYYAAGGDKTVVRASTKDGGGQIVNGPKASAKPSYPNTSKAKQGAQRGTDYAKWVLS